MSTIVGFGDDALLVEVAGVEQVMALRASLAATLPAGVEEVVPAARTLLLTLAPGADRDAIAADVRGRSLAGPVAGSGELVEIPVRYDGPDLDEVGARTGLSTTDVIAAHGRNELTVAFAGFAPGFGYLVGIPRVLHVPRRPDPRTRVPAGAVGLAAEFTGVYPRQSPGGWQLIGHTDTVVWDPDRSPPALLRAGTRVRFRPA